jgi:hypothetical protein
MDDGWIMSTVAMDDGGSMAFLMLGLLAAIAGVRLALRATSRPISDLAR